MPLDRFQLQQNVSAASNPARYVTDTTSFDQLNAISAVQGLTLITSNRFNSVGSVSINNCFNSLYQNYRVLLTLTDVSADSDFTLRYRSRGFDNVSALYDNSFIGIGASAGAASNATGGSGTSIPVGESDANVASSFAKTVRYKLVLDVLSPAEPESTVCLGQYIFINKAANDSIMRVGGSTYQFITPFDGFSFISSSTYSITGISAASGRVTYSIANTTGLFAGQTITITGSVIPGYNGTFSIASVTTNTNITVINPTTGVPTPATATGVVNPNVSGIVRVYGYKS